MFFELTHINSYNETCKGLINTDNIVSIMQNHVEPLKLYDIDGNLVSEQPRDNVYSLLCSRGNVFYINESEYLRLVDLLTTLKK